MIENTMELVHFSVAGLAVCRLEAGRGGGCAETLSWRKACLSCATAPSGATVGWRWWNPSEPEGCTAGSSPFRSPVLHPGHEHQFHDFIWLFFSSFHYIFCVIIQYFCNLIIYWPKKHNFDQFSALWTKFWR